MTDMNIIAVLLFVFYRTYFFFFLIKKNNDFPKAICVITNNTIVS